MERLIALRSYLATCCRRGAEKSDIDDLLQDVFLQLLQSADDYGGYADFTEQELQGFAAVCVRNHCINLARRQTQRRSIEMQYAVEKNRLALDLACSQEAAAILEAAVSKLPSEHEKAILALFLRGNSEVEIAEELGRKVSSISRTLFAALRRLRGILLDDLN